MQNRLHSYIELVDFLEGISKKILFGENSQNLVEGYSLEMFFEELFPRNNFRFLLKCSSEKVSSKLSSPQDTPMNFK